MRKSPRSSLKRERRLNPEKNAIERFVIGIVKVLLYLVYPFTPYNRAILDEEQSLKILLTMLAIGLSLSLFFLSIR